MKRKTSFPKEILENANPHKPVLNKIMTIHTSTDCQFQYIHLFLVHPS